jgi:hypothetical protein
MTTTTGKAALAAEQLLEKLEGVNKEEDVRAICKAIFDSLFEEKVVRRSLDTLRKSVKEKYPEKPPNGNKPDGYYLTNTGKGKRLRYEHLALWYLSDPGDKISHFEVIGDAARKEYWNSLSKIEELQGEPTECSATETNENKPKEESMSIEKVLEMDAEMSEIATAAMEQLNISLEEFAKRAFKYYALSVTGKAQQKRQQEAEDLAEVPTKDLIDEESQNYKKYRSHPKRAEELTKRAIRAIKAYNETQGESAAKWAITPSIIHELIGSKPASIKEILATIPDIKGYHFALFGDEEPSHTQNRKKDKFSGKPYKIGEVIDLAALVPDGYTD